MEQVGVCLRICWKAWRLGGSWIWCASFSRICLNPGERHTTVTRRVIRKVYHAPVLTGAWVTDWVGQVWMGMGWPRLEGIGSVGSGMGWGGVDWAGVLHGTTRTIKEMPAFSKIFRHTNCS